MAAVAMTEESTPSPWEIAQVAFGKWGNGIHKLSTWYKGSFPNNIPGTTEQPEWFVNGSPVGKSQMRSDLRYIRNSSDRFKPGSNTVKVQFEIAPYAGAFYECTISDFSW